eukprot:34791_1
MSDMSLAQLLNTLRENTNQKQQDAKEATAIFKKFQLQLIRTGHKLTTPQDLKAAMEGLEIGAQIAINVGDLLMFDRVIIQLKQYYLIENVRNQSSQRQHLMGLYLMYLLTENRFGDFHVEIELLSFDDLENKYIKFPMRIEQFMMEGSYGEIWNSRDHQPDKTYTVLMSKLEQTVRDEIAESLQCVHDQMPLKDALEMLKLNNPQSLQQYIKTKELKWSITNDTLTFAAIKAKEQKIEAVVTAKDMLEFTNNIETIV